MDKSPGRKPPLAVLTELRREVRFHCPADTADGKCGSPYLTWHHFDPPWRVEHHHRPAGMIALCREHADKADNGAYTNDQLRRFKTDASSNTAAVAGRFDWMRNRLLARVGGNYYLDVPYIFVLAGVPMIWFTRNEHDELMLNYRMYGQPGSGIQDNVWEIDQDGVGEVICPPGARTLEVRYSNGDLFKAEFEEFASADDLVGRFSATGIVAEEARKLNYPITAVSLTEVTKNGILQMHPDRMTYGGDHGFVMKNSWSVGSRVGIMVGSPPPSPLRPDQLYEIDRVLADFHRRR